VKTHGVYRTSVKHNRQKSARAAFDCRLAFNSLNDKTTTYARELAELLALLGRVDAVWQGAPDDIQESEAGK